MIHGKPKTLHDFSIRKSPSSTSYIDVYSFSSLQHIENLLQKRLLGYSKIYSRPLVYIHEKTISAFFSVFMATNTDCGIELKNFINSFRNNGIENIDLQEFLEWDDIRLYSQILDVAEHHSNPNVRSLAIMTIPNMESFLNMIYSHLQIKNSIPRNYSCQDKEFLKKLKTIICSHSEFALALRNPNYTDQNTLFFDISSYDDISTDFIFKHSEEKKAYNPNQPIYIRDTMGKIYELSHHPNRSYDWDKLSLDLKSCYTYIPYLRFNGMSEKDIEYLRSLSCGIEHYRATTDTDYSSKINMQPLQVGHSIEKHFIEINEEIEK